jgi:hypothetical protein
MLMDDALLNENFPQMQCMHRRGLVWCSAAAVFFVMFYINITGLLFIFSLVVSVFATQTAVKKGGAIMTERFFCQEHGEMTRGVAKVRGQNTILIVLIGVLVGLTGWNVMQTMQTSERLSESIGVTREALRGELSVVQRSVSNTKDDLHMEIGAVRSGMEDLRTKYSTSTSTLSVRVKHLEENCRAANSMESR